MSLILSSVYLPLHSSTSSLICRQNKKCQRVRILLPKSGSSLITSPSKLVIPSSFRIPFASVQLSSISVAPNENGGVVINVTLQPRRRGGIATDNHRDCIGSGDNVRTQNWVFVTPRPFYVVATVAEVAQNSDPLA